MPSFCAVVGCGSRPDRDRVRFYRFPSAIRGGRGRERTIDDQALKRRKAWVNSLHRKNLTESIIKNERICSKHFVTGKPAALEDVNHPDWVPSVNMGYSEHSCDLQRYERAKKRKQISQENEPQPGCSSNTNEPVEADIVELEPTLTEEPLSICVDYKKELQLSYENNYILKDQLNKLSLDFPRFSNSEETCKFYTGLPYTTLDTLYKDVEPLIPQRSITKTQQLLLFFMKMRLNLLFSDLGYRFNINRRTASRIFYSLLRILYCKLKCLIKWPERHVLMANKPACFSEKFKDVSVIVDCLEIFTETPTSKIAASQHFSHYKNHATLKYLIAIAPHGSIMFISKGYGGRSSDKFVTEQCGFLDKLSPGDVVLADRGFLISDQVNMCMAELCVPPFLKGKKQLTAREVEEGRRLSNVRIHVERVIGLLKIKYTILHQTLPMHIIKKTHGGVPVIDKIITVACALCNLCPPVV